MGMSGWDRRFAKEPADSVCGLIFSRYLGGVEATIGEAQIPGGGVEIGLGLEGVFAEGQTGQLGFGAAEHVLALDAGHKARIAGDHRSFIGHRSLRLRPSLTCDDISLLFVL
jgi:hypothetical protein